MYNSYFGFREKPFKLVPNPEYLFLSKSHEIALAHLTYAAEQGEGFVVITGEVGTGKTTLCRNFLEGLDWQTDSAYIFNPHLNPNELLVSIIHEFGIETKEESIKPLLDILNQFLIMQNSAGRKVVLLIDEAQILSTENLELVRMLSNLETTKNKLLQIILVGQPELAEKLESYELRQLAQRISLNYRLAPLSDQDTEAYIQHRIGIASQKQTRLFTPEACRMAFRHSGGIPRLINIACDRALLTAYSQNKPGITKSVMQDAIADLTNASEASAKPGRKRLLVGSAIGVAMIAVALVAIVIAGGFRYPIRPFSGTREPGSQKPFKIPAVNPESAAQEDQGREVVETIPKPDAGVVTQAAVAGNEPAVASAQAAPEGTYSVPSAPVRSDSVDTLLIGLDAQPSRKSAAAKLLTLWWQPRPNVDLIPAEVDDASFFNVVARQYGLRSYVVRGNWGLVEKVDLPAILTLINPDTQQSVYLCLTGLNGTRAHLSTGEGSELVEVELDALRPYFDGAVYIFWKNLIGFDMIIGNGADDRAVLMVKSLLQKIGYQNIPTTPDFDTDTVKAIRTFQAGHGLKVDGLVGPLTKIMLLRESGSAHMPQLSK